MTEGRRSLESEAQLPLEGPVLITLLGDRPEVRVVDAELRSVGQRMVQDVGGVKPELDCLALRDLKGLAQAAVERPTARPEGTPLSQRSPFARLRVLQNNPSR